MNKMVTPKQLELTAGKTRTELLLDAAPHIDPESPAYIADMAKVEVIEKEDAARAVLAASGPGKGGFAFGYRPDISEDDFDWDSPEEDTIVLREQRATAAYRNRAGELIIRQRASWNDDVDTFVYISPEN